jgi:uncharacterized membrane protein YccC
LRVLAAARATLAGVLAFFAVVVLSLVVTLPMGDRILGFAMALFIVANVHDSTPRQRLITIAVAPLVAFAAVVVATLLLDQPIAAAVLVPPLMFVISYGATRGPRYATVGIVGLIAYFVALVTHEPIDVLPARLLVVIIAGGSAALMIFVVLPERPEAEFERLRRAIYAGIQRVLARIATAVAAGAWTEAMRAELHRDVYRLGEIVMLAQTRVAALGKILPNQGGRWLHLLAIELATERIARVALQALGSPAERGALLASLQALRDDIDPPVQQSAGPLATALALLGRVLHEPLQEAPEPAAAPPPNVTTPGIRSSIQTGIAAALAIVSGELVSPSRWYWAAFAAYVMFQGTRSRGESIAKGVQFMVGTVSGVVIGALAATLLSGHDPLTLLAIIAAVFLAFQANGAAYGTMVFWITIILGLLFGMMGYFAPEFLLLRLKETGAGAICGVLVASFVLVRREYAATYDATIAFLRALQQSVHSAARVLLDGQRDPALAGTILTTEQRFRDLNAVIQSEQSSHPLTRSNVLYRRVVLLEACEQWSRELGQLCLQTIVLDDESLKAAARQAVMHIDASVSGLIDKLANQAVHPPDGGGPPAEIAPSAQETTPQRAVRLLLRIDSALLHLAAQ